MPVWLMSQMLKFSSLEKSNIIVIVTIILITNIILIINYFWCILIYFYFFFFSWTGDLHFQSGYSSL